MYMSKPDHMNSERAAADRANDVPNLSGRSTCQTRPARLTRPTACGRPTYQADPAYLAYPTICATERQHGA